MRRYCYRCPALFTGGDGVVGDGRSFVWWEEEGVKESRGVGGRKPTGQDKGCRNRGQASCKRRLPSPMHCAIALWLKIASDDELRTRGRKTPGEQTHAAKGGTVPGGGGKEGRGRGRRGSYLVIGMQGGGP